MKDTKQIIVMRKDLNMRKGKMISQGAHASVANILNLQIKIKDGLASEENQEELKEWLTSNFRKISVSVNSEEELMDIYNKAKEKALNVELIEDIGYTEFHGVKTKTCLAIGPHYTEKIDEITSHLKLL